MDLVNIASLKKSVLVTANSVRIRTRQSGSATRAVRTTTRLLLATTNSFIGSGLGSPEPEKIVNKTTVELETQSV